MFIRQWRYGPLYASLPKKGETLGTLFMSDVAHGNFEWGIYFWWKVVVNGYTLFLYLLGIHLHICTVYLFVVIALCCYTLLFYLFIVVVYIQLYIYLY